jgi:hypothetical protein
MKKVAVYCIRCDRKLGVEKVKDSFIGNAIFTLCKRCRYGG